MEQESYWFYNDAYFFPIRIRFRVVVNAVQMFHVASVIDWKINVDLTAEYCRN